MAGIFKKNDVRGVVGKTLTEDTVLKIGYIFGKIIGRGKNISIAGDTRESTPRLKENMINGLRKAGVNVFDLGIGPTPMVYYSCANYIDVDNGIMITGSHNPIGQNGIKICDKDGAAYTYDTLFKRIEEEIELVDLKNISDLEQTGEFYDRKDIKEQYFAFLQKELQIDNKLDIIVDVGNGATGEAIKFTLNHSKINATYLNINSNGIMSQTPPDPAKENAFEELKQVIDGSYDIAICFDGDGDRVGFMTSDRNIISPDQVTMLIADDIVKNDSDVKIIIDVKISKATKEFANKLGCDVILSQVGHSYIHELLIETNAQFAAELSGHYYFNDNYFGYDDGLYAAIRFLNLLSKMKSNGKNIIEVLKQLPRYYSTKEYRDPVPKDKQIEIIDKVKKYAMTNKANIIELDGIRAEFEDSWFLVRSSGTEEALSYRIEGDTEDSRDKLFKILKNMIISE